MENDILATYNDGSAGVVITSSDAGAMAVINADLGTSNLPRTSAFVPMLNELIAQMLDRGRGADSAFCGEPLAAQLPADAGPSVGLRIVPPAARGAESRNKRLRRTGQRSGVYHLALAVADTGPECIASSATRPRCFRWP